MSAEFAYDPHPDSSGARCVASPVGGGGSFSAFLAAPMDPELVVKQVASRLVLRRIGPGAIWLPALQRSSNFLTHPRNEAWVTTHPRRDPVTVVKL